MQAGETRRLLRPVTGEDLFHLVYFALVILLAHQVTDLRFAQNRFLGGATPELLVAGEGTLPQQYRLLVPWLVRAAVDLGVLHQQDVMWALRGIEFLFLVALGVVFRFYLACFIGNSVLVSTLSLSIFLFLPHNYVGSFWMPSDIPSVFFFTLLLLLLYRRETGWYYVVFAVATLNRETTLFVAATFLFVEWSRRPLREVVLHLGLQALIWTGIKGGLAWGVGGRSSAEGLFQVQLLYNLQDITTFRVFRDFIGNWGFAWVPVLFCYKSIQSEFIKRTLWCVPVLVMAMLVVGVLDERRVFGEALPIVLSALCVLIVGLAGIDARPSDRSDPADRDSILAGPTR